MELCTGQVLGDASSTITPPPQPLPVSTSRPPPPPQDVADVIQQMCCGEAVGLDEVLVEILKAGGGVLDGKAAASPRCGRRKKIAGRAKTSQACSSPTM